MDGRMTSLSMNERACSIADVMAEESGGLRIEVTTLPTGTRVIDAGVKVAGGLNAGLLLSEICMGGLGDVEYCSLSLGGENWPGVQVHTDHPAISCMASQYAGWAIQVDKYFAMGSGPLRAHARVEKDLFEKLQYAEEASAGVLVLEGREMGGLGDRARTEARRRQVGFIYQFHHLLPEFSALEKDRKSVV